MSAAKRGVRKAKAPRKKKPEAPRPAEKRVTCPTKYKPEYAEQAKKLCELGAIDTDLAEFFHVTRATIHNWQIDHPEFKEALRLGKKEADDLVEQRLLQRAIGYSQEAVKIFLPAGATTPTIVPYTERFAPDTAAIAFWLKNRRPNDWRDRSQHEHSGPDGGPIETRETNAPELARRISRIIATAAVRAQLEPPKDDESPTG